MAKLNPVSRTSCLILAPNCLVSRSISLRRSRLYSCVTACLSPCYLGFDFTKGWAFWAYFCVVLLIIPKKCLAIENFCLSLHRISLSGGGWAEYIYIDGRDFRSVVWPVSKDVFKRYLSVAFKLRNFGSRNSGDVTETFARVYSVYICAGFPY